MMKTACLIVSIALGCIPAVATDGLDVERIRAPLRAAGIDPSDVSGLAHAITTADPGIASKAASALGILPLTPESERILKSALMTAGDGVVNAAAWSLV